MRINLDGLNFLSGEMMKDVNRTAFTATAIAHSDGGVPNIVIEADDRSAHTFGYLVYFFELACGVSAYMLGVNPFNQPGVESIQNQHVRASRQARIRGSAYRAGEKNR